MATLYITELSGLSFDPHGNDVMAPAMPPLVEQTLGISGSSQVSNPFSPSTRYVMLNCDSVCSLAWGTNPTAAVTAQRMGANETRFYGVIPGQQVAVIANT